MTDDRPMALPSHVKEALYLFPYLEMTPEEYAARRTFRIWRQDLWLYRYPDVALDRWVSEVCRLLRDPQELDRCRKAQLSPTDCAALQDDAYDRRDEMTGLPCLRYFERHVRSAVATALTTDRRHAILYLDLNQFREMNHVHGHTAGDAMLVELADVIRGAVPTSSHVARIGGDEFGVLLEDCPSASARELAEHVARAIGDHRFVWKDQTISVGVTVGLVEVSSDSGTFEDVMRTWESAYVGAKSRAIPVYYFGMEDPVAVQRVKQIAELVQFFLPHCTEQSTLRELEAMASDAERWRHGHALFGQIRLKTLQADATHDRLLEFQYSFEEICAKTLYNMSGQAPQGRWPYPFDSDSPSWAVPISIQFAEALGIDDLRQRLSLDAA